MEIVNTSTTDPINVIKEIFIKINEVRTNPIKLANKLSYIMSYINKRDNILREPNKPVIKLIEGIKAFEEAITFLKNFSAVEELILEDSLSKIAQEHAIDIGSKGVTNSHTINDSSDGKIKYEDRFKRFGTYTDLQEIVIFSENDPLRIVLNLLVSDGDEKRTNRNIILSSNLRQLGIGLENHTKLNYVAVLDFSRNWKIRQLSPLLRMINDDKNKSHISDSNKNGKFSNEFIIDFNPNNTLLNSLNINSNLEELVYKYDKELDKEIYFEEFVSKDEEKQIIQENNKIKLIKRITFTFTNSGVRKIILSKTFSSK